MGPAHVIEGPIGPGPCQDNTGARRLGWRWRAESGLAKWSMRAQLTEQRTNTVCSSTCPSRCGGGILDEQVWILGTSPLINDEQMTG
jgi:hypothetical protein